MSAADQPGDERLSTMRLAPTLADRARELVDGPRQDEYDAPERNMARVGATWAAMLGLEEPIAPHKVALMLAGLKVIRAAHTPSDDSIADAHGYLLIAERTR